MRVIDRVYEPSEAILDGQYQLWNKERFATLRCPECGSEYNHLLQPTVIPGYDNYEADYAHWDMRGDLLVIPVWCEEAHLWEICVGFHKGHNAVYLHVVGEIERDDEVDEHVRHLFVRAQRPPQKD